MSSKAVVTALAAACLACGQTSDTPDDNETRSGAAPTSDRVGPRESIGLPDDRTPISEGPIDPKSAKGAGEVLQLFAALLEQRRFAEANDLTEGDFSAAFANNMETHMEIGAPGPMEGAAGSIYVEFPIRIYGKSKDAGAFSQRAKATLRRANDVPGSTEEQRGWRIYRLDMQPAS